MFFQFYKMDKYGLKKRYDFVPQFSPLRPGTFSCSGHYLIPRNEPQKSCSNDDVAVDFVAINNSNLQFDLYFKLFQLQWEYTNDQRFHQN